MTEWMQDQRLEKISQSKLDFLQKVIFDISHLEKEEKLPFLMALATSSGFQKLSFSKSESEVLMEVLKDYSGPEEFEKASAMLSLFQKR